MVESRSLNHLTIWQNGEIHPFKETDTISPTAKEMHDAIRLKVQGSSFPCVGAKSAFNKSAYAVGVYDVMHSSDTTERLHDDLSKFFKFHDSSSSRTRELFITFVAIFAQQAVANEEDFHGSLWKQLQLLHDVDRKEFPWDDRVDSDINSENFSYSLGGTAFFVVGMNPQSSRLSRQFNWPALVFNPGPQFEKIREIGIHDSMKETIRRKDIELQGDINPTLADFGHGNVALTYSGLNTGDISKCPFHAKP